MSNLVSTSDRILECARARIVVGGYNGFSYADIAEAVGIRKASIHHHFPSKADLVEALVAGNRKGTETALAGLERAAVTPLDQLERYAGYWQDCIADGSRPFCLCALLACEMDILPPKVAAEVQAYFRLLADAFTRTMESGARAGVLALRDAPAVEAEVFMATIHGAMLSARATGRPEIFTTITASLLSRLTARN